MSPALYPVVTAVAAALLCGAVLMAPEYSVGPYHLLTDGAGAVVERFACLDRGGAPCVFSEVWAEPLLIGDEVYLDDQYGPDWTAFGAALACPREEAVA